MTDSEAEARKYAYRLLSYRSRSIKELQERLEKKGFGNNEISSTLKHLEKAGFLDDQALALNLKHQASDNKLFGHHRTRRWLLERGIPSEIVDATLEYSEDAETHNIRKLIDKKLKSMGNYPAEKKMKRLHDLLMRKGYSYGIIKTALQNTFHREEDE